jgi:nucleoside diphosphate kinase homolog 5
LTAEQCSDFYSEHYGKKFFPSLVAFMTSGPILALVLAKDNAIQQWRELIGPTNSNLARETHADRCCSNGNRLSVLMIDMQLIDVIV